jgi:dihydroflavonol-4-reductase
MAGIDSVFHLAAIYKLWLPEPKLIYDVNVEGGKTVLFAAWKAGVKKLVYTSSIAAIGVKPGGEPADETTPFNVWNEANDYIRSKYLSELDALRFAQEGLPVVVVNPSFPFGERDIGPTPTGRFILQILRGELPGYPEGGFNAVDVEDVAEAHLAAEERGKVGDKYIAGGHNVTWKEFFALVADVAGVKPPRMPVPSRLLTPAAHVAEWIADHVTHKEPRLTVKDAAWGGRRYYFDAGKVRRELGVPLTPLRDSVTRSVAWFRANKYAP